MERRDTSVDIRLIDRLYIGRTIINAAQIVDQTPLPPLTDEVKYIGIRNLRAQSPTKTSAPPTPSPTPRLKGMVSLLPKTQELISTAQQSLGDMNISRKTSPISTHSTSRDTTPKRGQVSSRGQTPSGFQTPARAFTPSAALQSLRRSALVNKPLISTRRSLSVAITGPSTPIRPEDQTQRDSQSGSQQGQFSTRITRSKKEF
jgi:hypothetical protein